jgi:hypothetical protein
MLEAGYYKLECNNIYLVVISDLAEVNVANLWPVLLYEVLHLSAIYFLQVFSVNCLVVKVNCNFYDHPRVMVAKLSALFAMECLKVNLI